MALTTMPNGPMTTRRIDDAAFGVVYGSVSVLALLMATHLPIADAGRQAGLLFFTVFAVALAKAFAEICERMLQSGTAATWQDAREVWNHSQTVLLAANGPTLAFALAAFGVISVAQAVWLAQVLALALLSYFGARIGWRIGGTVVSAFVAAAVTSGIGMLVSLFKFLIH